MAAAYSASTSGYIGHDLDNILLRDGDDSPPFLFPDEDQEEICYIGNCDASLISLTCDSLICIPGWDSIQFCNPVINKFVLTLQEQSLFPTEKIVGMASKMAVSDGFSTEIRFKLPTFFRR
ncbi:unnamed protein product [Arabidopsis lyrata]|uniref:Predicted protein n=1 Tax=Arabidopsis lyrata subsp. lyrata TaxID=81972 RepID=D7LWF8_ARALL|nr:predicted protein [Arabidopsis lyrata subsp. lyrata]CAH8269189.1 unnamed protein product [Arabidopsis lyrata]